MRRSDREVVDLDEILEIIKKCDVCCLAFFDKDFPYIVPMNFGVILDEGHISLLFHGANAGKKLDLIKKNNKVAFEMDCSHKLILGEKACNATMEYESVCGNGIIEILNEHEKVDALTALMNQYSPNKNHVFLEEQVKAVTVFKLVVNEITAKRLKIK